jgi:hypothetical protein
MLENPAHWAVIWITAQISREQYKTSPAEGDGRGLYVYFRFNFSKTIGGQLWPSSLMA